MLGFAACTAESLPEGGTSSGSGTPAGIGAAAGFARPRTEQTIVAGFDLTIEKLIDGSVELAWPDQGVTEYEVWSSSHPYFSPGEQGSTLLATQSTRTLVTTSTGETYYRVRADGAPVELSTIVGQLDYDLYAGYTKLGWCLISDIDTWSELQADMPSQPTGASMWSSLSQGWVITNLAFDVGEVISVLHPSSPSPSHYMAVGYVPTESDVSVTLLPGDNLVTTLPLRFGPIMASDLWAAVDGAVRIGGWDAAAQVTHYYPEDGDFLLPTCSPVHVIVSTPSSWPPPPLDPGGGSTGATTASSEGETGTERPFFLDADGDGFGDPSQMILEVTQPPGYVENDDDCDDADPLRNPAASEICNAIDDDCDGDVDEVDAAIDDARAAACNAVAQPEDPLTAGDGTPGDALPIGSGHSVTLVPSGNAYRGVLTLTPPDSGDYVVVATGVATLEVATAQGEFVDPDESLSLAECGGANRSIRVALDGSTLYELRITEASDEELAVTVQRVAGHLYYPDGDGDDFGTGEPVRACALPPGHALVDGDCDDTDPSIHPDAEDICDGVDNDCDGSIDQGQTLATYYLDADGDGFGSETTQSACSPPAGYVAVPGDCDDADPTVFPGHEEVCDGRDNDCDGEVDEDVGQTFYADADGDGHGLATVTQVACSAPPGYVSLGDDCDDTNPAIYPGAPEICDALDNDCNGIVDDNLTSTFYPDLDGDGHGNPLSPVSACTPPPGHVALGDDCNDGHALSFPGAPEICDGLDNDCDGDVDELGAEGESVFYVDADGDAYGDLALPVIACVAPVGTSPLAGDCNDADPAMHPLAVEVCDGIDNNCDGEIDPEGAVGSELVSPDADGDGFGDPTQTQLLCTVPSGFVTNQDDCDDTDNTVHPMAIELCDLVDNNCNGLVDDACLDETGLPSGPPDDPAVIAPALDPTVVVDLPAAVRFLYEGDDRIQYGVAPGTIEPERVAVVRGRVLDVNGDPLGGVRISVLNHPELGATRTRVDGMFDLAVNGGGALTIELFGGQDHLTAQRSVHVPWHDLVHLRDDVVLVELDPEVNVIDFSEPMQVAQGTPQSDADGTRQATLLFAQGTVATAVLPNGTEQVLSSISVRATEYTVGERGPEAMPGILPAASAYTYAVEYTVDEAEAIGAREVRFEPAAVSYTENFVGFPVGELVPGGYYDAERAAWIGGSNGVVVQIVDIGGGLAELDLTGDGVAATAAELAAAGVSDAERESLAELYDVGAELWRVPVSHFSPWDYNWGIVPPDDAVTPPDDGPYFDPPMNNPNLCRGSVVDVENQVLGERMPIAGTSLSLHYSSRNAYGRTASRSLEIPLSDASPPASLRSIGLHLDVAGQHSHQWFSPSANLSHTFIWDGIDAYGRLVQGPSPVSGCIEYVYPVIYVSVSSSSIGYRFGYNGNGTVLTGAGRGASSLSLWRCFGNAVAGGGLGVGRTQDRRALGGRALGLEVGLFDARRSAARLGGWTLDVHHTLAPESGTLFTGDGRRRDDADGVNYIIGTYAGGGTITNWRAMAPGTPATELLIGTGGPSSASALAFDPDGTLYVASTNTILAISPDGGARVFAGAGASTQPSGNGGPAINATFAEISDLAQGPDGSLYVADSLDATVRRIDAQGIIHAFAGRGANVPLDGDGGPATLAGVARPRGLAVAPDGTVYIAQEYGSGSIGSRIRRVTPDGTIHTFAGGGTLGIPRADSTTVRRAIDTRLDDLIDVAVGPQGDVYILCDSLTSRLYKVSLDGRIVRIAGGGSPFDSVGDGLPGADAQLDDPQSVAVDAQGTIFIADRRRVRYLEASGVIYTLAGTGAHASAGDGGSAASASFYDQIHEVDLGPDGAVYVAEGRGIRRISGSASGYAEGESRVASEDGREVYLFDATGRHLSTYDAITGVTRWSFSYDAEGYLIGVSDAFDNTTTIERDASGEATAIESPYGVRTNLQVTTEGYLTAITNPASETEHFTYTSDGLLVGRLDTRGGQHTYTYDSEGRLVRGDDPAGGFQTLTRTWSEDQVEVVRSSAMGRPFTTLVARDETAETRTASGANGVTATTHRDGTDHATSTHADGTTVSTDRRPDPRFGMQAPLLAITASTPGGTQWSGSVDRATDLASSDFLQYPTAWTETRTSPTGQSTTHYDRATSTVTTTSAEGRTVTSVLGSHGEPVSSQVGNLTPVQFSYDAEGRVTGVMQSDGTTTRTASVTYDTQGFVAQTIDPLGRVTQYEYDEVGRVVRQIFPDLREVTFDYDAAGNLTSLSPPSRPAHGFTYDAVDQMTAYNPPSVPDVTTPTTVYTYNLDRQVEQVVRPDGEVVDFVYDTVTGQLTETVTARGSYAYAYNSAGRVSTATDPGGGSLNYIYDGSLVLSETLTGAVSGSVGWSYDSELRVSAHSVNGIDPVNLIYDRDNNLVGVGLETLVRDTATGLLTNTTLGGTTSQLTYGGDGSLASISVAAGSTPLYSETLTRDGVGRIKVKEEVLDGTPRTRCYEYDDSGRLTGVFDGYTGAECSGTLVEAYDYDGNSNRIYALNDAGEVLPSEVVIDAQDRLRQYGSQHFTYEANGELDTREDTVTGEAWDYDYDAMGNLVRVVTPSGEVIEYITDARDRRVGKRVNGVLVQGFLYGDQLNPIAELDGAGNVVARFVYGSWDHVPDYMVRGGVTYRIVSDHLGSVMAVVNVATGEIVQQREYDAWGRGLSESTVTGFSQPFGFAGGVWDQDVGFARFGVRDYAPLTGRWSMRDPVGFGGKDVNLHNYVFGDPINLVDLDGQAAQAATLGGRLGGAIGGAIGGPVGAAVGAGVGLGAGYLACLASGLCPPPHFLPPYPEFFPARPLGECRPVGGNLGDLSRLLSKARPRLTPLPQRPDTRECDAEWEEAIDSCRELVQHRTRNHQQRSGGYTDLLDCARGLVSMDCGGNPV